ncbi:hypothetical protein COY28_05520, partial [Candidatus Woesearchaeota archaeon CG_4_10_14_0_2_um_filter_57_5]
ANDSTQNSSWLRDHHTISPPPNFAPEVLLITPINSTNSSRPYIQLNATANDTNGDTYLLQLWAGNETPNRLLFQNITTGFQNITYNVTALPVAPGDNDLIMLYHLDNNSNIGEGTYNITDSSGRGNNASCSPTGNGIYCPRWNNTGKFAGASHFNGTGTIWSSNLLISPSEYPEITISAWIKPDASGTGYDGIITADDGGWDRGFGINSNNYAVQVGNQEWDPSGATITVGTWQHVALVYGTTDITFYLNGKSYSYGDAGSFGASTEPVTIGNDVGCGSCYFKGMLDELSIWNRSLTADEIHTLANLRNGTYLWKANATDYTASNTTESRTIELGTIPIITFENPTPATGNHSQSYIDVNVSASGWQLTNVTIRLYNTTDLVNQSNSNSSPSLINWTGLPLTTYYVNATANSSTGKQTDTTTRTITLRIAPTLTNTTGILPAPAYNTSSLNYTFMVTDTDGDTVTIQINWTNSTHLLYQENITTTTP